ncbi:hypothetical protein D9M72_645370 [compost metagenome]
MDAGDVAGGGDHAALAAADNNRLVGKLRVVTFFDGRVKRIAIDMGQRQVVEFRMPQKPRTTAGKAASRGRGLFPKAITAEAWSLRTTVEHIWNKC